MSKVIISKMLVVLAVLFLLSGIAYAADAKDQGKDVSVDTGKDTSTDVKKNDTVVDKTKETSKNIDTGIKVKDTTSSLSSYKVSKEKDQIKVTKSDEMGHTKTILTLDKATAQSIDIDKDNKFGYARFVDGQLVESKIVTLAELNAGIPVTFSEVIVNGLSGTRTTTFLNVTSGQTLNIQDSTTADAVTVSVGGSVPSYVAINPLNKTSFPNSDKLICYWDFNNVTGNSVSSTWGGPAGTKKNMTVVGGTAYQDTSGGISNPFTSGAGNKTYGILAKTNVTTGERYLAYLNGNEIILKYNHDANRLYISNGTSYPYVTIDLEDNKYHYYQVTLNNINDVDYVTLRVDGIVVKTTSYKKAYNTAKQWFAALYSGKPPYSWSGSYDNIIWYNGTLSNASINSLYPMGSGISFQPEPSYNFTGYDVSSGTAKTLDIDSTVTGIEVVNTAGTTLSSATVVEYYTNDTTVILDSHTSTQQTVNISHSVPAIMDTGTISYEILPLYSGTPSMVSTNPNATISRNDTHFIISTGYMAASETYGYNVTIEDTHDHGMWLDTVMKWVGTGWDFVDTAPTTWANYIGDEIEVTVS